MSSAPEPAPALLRMLRQGRGDGFREALRAGRSAAPHVLSCVVDDPRWDRQVEERDHYYASLLIRLDVDVAPIAERLLREDEEDETAFWLPLGVLAEMARRAHGPAKAALAEVIRARGGDVDALEAPREIFLEAVFSSESVGGLAARGREPAGPDVDAGLPTDQLLPLVTSTTWRRVEQILRTRVDDTTLHLLLRAASTGTPDQQLLALRILGERGVDDLVDAAERYLRDEAQAERKQPRTRQAYLRYLERLPGRLTLERARRWFTEPWPLRLAGEHVLARNATHEDRPVLEDAGSAALTQGDMYRLCSVVDALATVGAIDSIPLLHEVYTEAPYSYARRRVVRALVPHVAADRATRDRIEEALWDCEAKTRELACSAVSASDDSNARRLAELADDPFEGAGVREGALLTLRRRGSGP